MNNIRYIFLLLITVLLVGCGREYLRGSVSASADNKTYLIISDNNGGHCGDIFVDGKIWKHKLDNAGLILAGDHTIKCGFSVKIFIPQGVIFNFDYWGP